MALAEILEQKRRDVAERKALAPLEGWCDALVPSDRSLLQRLRTSETAFILECKQASPSEGRLRPGFDAVAIARTYAPFATAISVLTDGPFFGGSFEHLRAVRAAVAQPVLCKDFVVDPWQVYEARRHGADIVLLMLSVLDDDTYRACRAAADRLALDVLTEVHDEVELQRAVALDAPVIGINNRNLRTLAIDLDTSRVLAPRVPRDRFVISESGLRTHGQVRALWDQVDGFLVGSSLMKAPDLGLAVRELCFGPVKVCGLTRPEDAQAAWHCGATWGGMIFYPKSLRGVSQGFDFGCPLRPVGVFVNETPERVAALAAEHGMAAVQLHGDEDEGYVSRLRGMLAPDTEIWLACRIADTLPDSVPHGVDRMVFDTASEAARGGTGRRWNWDLLRGYPSLDRVMLSGGLTPELAAEAARAGAAGLDVNSGVEERPGIKDPALMQAFFRALRARGQRGILSTTSCSPESQP